MATRATKKQRHLDSSWKWKEAIILYPSTFTKPWKCLDENKVTNFFLYLILLLNNDYYALGRLRYYALSTVSEDGASVPSKKSVNTLRQGLRLQANLHQLCYEKTNFEKTITSASQLVPDILLCFLDKCPVILAFMLFLVPEWITPYN